jgi:hypothetical protein
MVLWHSESWKNKAGKLSPDLVLMMRLPHHQPVFGGRINKEYISDTLTANADVPSELECVVIGGGGTRFGRCGGDSASDMSTRA